MIQACVKFAVLLTVTSLWAALAHAQVGAAQPSAAGTGASSPAQGALGDLSGFRSIALDILQIVQAGDFPAARKRVDELESTWKRAAPRLKRLSPDKWNKVDVAIERAERELRFWRARRTDSVLALEELVRAIDSTE